MNIEIISKLLEVISNYPHLVILFTLWLTYSHVILHGGHVSDDLAGIEQYDGTLLYPDESGKKVRKITYGTLSKWVRYHLAGGHFPSRHRPKRADGTLGDPIPSGKVSRHHHVLSLICASIAMMFLYQFLLTITSPVVALLTCLLFIAHPTGTQAVAWPSAIGYILSLICICASLNISHWTYLHQTLPGILIGAAGLTFFQIWGVYAQAIPMFTWVILLCLGQWEMAIVAFLASSLASAINLRGYIVHRKEEFAKQKMGQSTSFNLRKPIVALKTIAYYFHLSLWPAKLGLYHKWGFHYDRKMERWDWRAVAGLLIVASSIYLFIHSGTDIRVAILWFYFFLFLFLNWITAQQWVTERYLYIPIIGICLIASTLLQAYLPLYFLILGLLLCRTLTHLPTYDNELRFYLSNTWNFNDSEVAYGNLGVAYASAGLGGAANDMWLISSSLNPDYDVPHYNIFSRIKSQGFMMIQNGAYEQGLNTIASAIPVMEKVLTCKVLHFPDMWKKELEDLKLMVANPINLLVGELNRLYTLRSTLSTELSQSTDQKRITDLTSSLYNNDAQINSLSTYLGSKGIQVDFDPRRALLSKLTSKGA